MKKIWTFSRSDIANWMKIVNIICFIILSSRPWASCTFYRLTIWWGTRVESSCGIIITVSCLPAWPTLEQPCEPVFTSVWSIYPRWIRELTHNVQSFNLALLYYTRYDLAQVKSCIADVFLLQDDRFGAILKVLRLQQRGSQGEETDVIDNVYDISNSERLGTSEV